MTAEELREKTVESKPGRACLCGWAESRSTAWFCSQCGRYLWLASFSTCPESGSRNCADGDHHFGRRDHVQLVADLSEIP